MTVNIEALIYSLGRSYQDLVDVELIPYKTLHPVFPVTLI